MDPRLPDFVGIGAQRAASSWTWRMLLDHPQTYGSQKEMRVFHGRTPDPAAYAAAFADAPAEALCGEFSPSYLYRRGVAPRMASLIPEARLVVVLRNPVDRAFSQWKNMRRRRQVPLERPFLDQWALDFPRVSMKERGMYAGQLQRFLDRFDRDQIFIGLYDDLVAGPGDFVESLYSFMGIDSTFRSPRLLDGDPDRQGRGEVNRGLRMTPEERAAVAPAYRSMIPRLEQMIDRDLSAWKE